MGSGLSSAATPPGPPGILVLLSHWTVGQDAGPGDKDLGVREEPHRVFCPCPCLQSGKTVVL